MFNFSKLLIGITTSHLTSNFLVYGIFLGIFLINFIFSVTSSPSIQFHLVIALIRFHSSYINSTQSQSNLYSIV